MLWTVIVVAVFAFSLYWLARSALVMIDALTPTPESSADILITAVSCALALVVVLALIVAYGTRTRVSSGSGSIAFAMMKTLMFIEGIALFIGGIANVFDANEFDEQVILALLALFYTVTPLALHLVRK